MLGAHFVWRPLGDLDEILKSWAAIQADRIGASPAELPGSTFSATQPSRWGWLCPEADLRNHRED
jgi:hypothetical protein